MQKIKAENYFTCRISALHVVKAGWHMGHVHKHFGYLIKALFILERNPLKHVAVGGIHVQACQG